MSESRATFASRLGTILTMVGVAVGLGTRQEHEAHEPVRQIPAMPALRIDTGDGDIRVVARPGDAVTYSSSLKRIGRHPLVAVSAGEISCA